MSRSKVESMVRLSKAKLEEGRIHLRLLVEEGIDVARPVTRGDCVGGVRPCPWVSCKHNLFLDVSNDTGSIQSNFPDLEPDEVPPEKSCALDIADHGGATLEDVAETMNVTRERVRQIESKGLSSARARAARKGTSARLLSEFSDAPPGSTSIRGEYHGGSIWKETPREDVEPAEVDEESEPPTRISFFADPDSERVDELVCASVWNMFAKDSNQRGFDCRSSQSRAQSKYQAAKREIKEEETMSNEEGLTDRQRAVLKAYRDLLKETGEPPTNLDIADRAKIEGSSDNARGANVSGAIRELRLKGLVGPPRRGPGSGAPEPAKPPAPRRVAPPPATRKPKAVAAVVEPKPARKASRDPIVAALITKRDELRSKASALDVAIEALSVAL